MTHFVADRILNDQGTIEEIISTTVITLGIATASLGVILMLMGRFKCADVVSYLPLPVVGGYLAFIGYFCVIAGVGLCISKSMIDGGFFADMQLLSDKKSLVLAIPGLVAGFIMMIVSRYATSDIALPMVMVMIPSMFYIVLYFNGYTMDDARENNWVGEVRRPIRCFMPMFIHVYCCHINIIEVIITPPTIYVFNVSNIYSFSFY